MDNRMLLTNLILSYSHGIKNTEMHVNLQMARENPLDKFLSTKAPHDAPEWLHLYWTVQNEMRMEKQRNGNKNDIQECNVPSQMFHERSSLSYEINLQRSYLNYARKELTYEEVQEIEARYKELKNLYWKLFGCML